jgi:predicted Zn-ribbon and HTH transcriptional regulator
MADIPTIPKLWGDLRLAQLHITGASFEKRETSTGPIMAPTHLTIGNKSQRWSLDISDAYETDRKGNRLGVKVVQSPPTSTPTPEERVKELEDLRKNDAERTATMARQVEEAEAKLKEVQEDLTETDKALGLSRMLVENQKREMEKLQEYSRLIATGLSDSEARGTVWPEAAAKEVECKMCGAPFTPEGIHKEVCPSCYSNEVNAGEHFEDEGGA